MAGVIKVVMRNVLVRMRSRYSRREISKTRARDLDIGMCSAAKVYSPQYRLWFERICPLLFVVIALVGLRYALRK